MLIRALVAVAAFTTVAGALAPTFPTYAAPVAYTAPPVQQSPGVAVDPPHRALSVAERFYDWHRDRAVFTTASTLATPAPDSPQPTPPAPTSPSTTATAASPPATHHTLSLRRTLTHRGADISVGIAATALLPAGVTLILMTGRRPRRSGI